MDLEKLKECVSSLESRATRTKVGLQKQHWAEPACLTEKVSYGARSNGNSAAQSAGQSRPGAGGSRQSRGTEAGSPVSHTAPTRPTTERRPREAADS